MTGPLLVLAPLWVEHRALRRRLAAPAVRHTGYGRRSADVPPASLDPAVRALAVAGVAGAARRGLLPGDVVVATEVARADGARDGAEPVRCPSAPLLAHALRRRGCRVHLGPVHTSDHVLSPAECARAAEQGALAVDLESAPLAGAAGRRAVAVARVVVDTPDTPLRRLDLPWRGLRALARLAAVAEGLQDWAAAVAPREVLLASPRSFCAGVERAIDVVERALARFPPPVYVRKQIVHNAHVVTSLRERGAVFVDELDEVPEGATVVLSAHGVAPAVREDAARRRLRVVDATCPLVAKVHAEARRHDRHGDQVVLIGHAGHEETDGTLGELGGRGLLVESVADVARLDVPGPGPMSYVMQTTLAVEEAGEIADALRARFPHISGPPSEDICYATSNRQHALREVARHSDVVVVLGSANSSNSRRLVEVAHRAGAEAHLVDDAGGIDPRWLAGAGTVGLSAGASAPPRLVPEVLDVLRGLGDVTVREHATVTESVRFSLPKEVAP